MYPGTTDPDKPKLSPIALENKIRNSSMFINSLY